MATYNTDPAPDMTFTVAEALSPKKPKPEDVNSFV